MEQEEYTKEAIDWSYIEFVDNQDVLDLIEKVFPFFFAYCLVYRSYKKLNIHHFYCCGCWLESNLDNAHDPLTTRSARLVWFVAIAIFDVIHFVGSYTRVISGP